MHVGIRWRSCPFEDVAQAVPKEGRVLEIGCGHGLFSVYLAVSDARRSVTGIDVDERKVAVARRVAKRAAASGASLQFQLSAPGQLPAGVWDAIAIVDVLYLLDRDAQEELLRLAASRLRPGGALVVKEMDVSPRWKFLWARAQELLAVRVLRITAGEHLTFVPPATMGAWLTDAGLTVEHRALDRGSVHPHHLLVARVT